MTRLDDLGHRDTAIEGRVVVRLTAKDGEVTAVDIESTRPLGASAVLEGKSAMDAIRALPLLYSICGTAHAAAGLAASEAALGITPSDEVRAARRVIVAGEALGQLLWRLFLDLPQVIEAETAFQALRDTRARLKRLPKLVYPRSDWLTLGGAGVAPRTPKISELAGVLEDIMGFGVFGEGLRAAGVLGDADRFAEWIARAETPVAKVFRYIADHHLSGFGQAFSPALRDADGDALAARLLSDDDRSFVARPDLDGTVYETGTFARFRGHPLISALLVDHGPGLLPRLASKLVAIEAMIDEIRLCGTPSPDETGLPEAAAVTVLAGGEGKGVVAVETARGRLLHAVRLENERTAFYRILAPTEWNFHREGPLAEALMGAKIGDREAFKTAVSLAIAAIDPCVQHDLVITGE
ncbi:MAG: hypothetical protein C0606_07665 [Hyphomicrobiales bacterium]|nr:MAG: hypothetical protein C0606_07665 [Hyphomicrobiales bacterium]